MGGCERREVWESEVSVVERWEVWGGECGE